MMIVLLILLRCMYVCMYVCMYICIAQNIYQLQQCQVYVGAEQLKIYLA